MNTNKILVSALMGGVAYFLLGWLVYGILLASIFTPAEAIQKNPMEVWAMIVGSLAYGVLIAIIYGRWANISTFVTGAKAGAVLGALSAVWIDFSMFAMYNFTDLQTSLIDVVVHAAISAITGGIIGWWLGRGAKG
jgi:hypothetical protein